MAVDHGQADVAFHLPDRRGPSPVPRRRLPTSQERDRRDPEASPWNGQVASSPRTPRSSSSPKHPTTTRSRPLAIASTYAPARSNHALRATTSIPTTSSSSETAPGSLPTRPATRSAGRSHDTHPPPVLSRAWRVPAGVPGGGGMSRRSRRCLWFHRVVRALGERTDDRPRGAPRRSDGRGAIGRFCVVAVGVPGEAGQRVDGRESRGFSDRRDSRWAGACSVLGSAGHLIRWP